MLRIYPKITALKMPVSGKYVIWFIDGSTCSCRVKPELQGEDPDKS